MQSGNTDGSYGMQGRQNTERARGGRHRVEGRTRGEREFFAECRRKFFGRMVTRLEVAPGRLRGASALQPLRELESKSAKKRLEPGNKAIRLVAGGDDYRPVLRTLEYICFRCRRSKILAVSNRIQGIFKTSGPFSEGIGRGPWSGVGSDHFEWLLSQSLETRPST